MNLIKGGNLQKKSSMDRVAAAESLAKAWNEAGICYAVAHGLEGYPKKIGRDLDIFVDSRDIHSAIELALKILDSRKELKIVYVNKSPYPLQSIYVFDEDVDLQLDFFTFLSWGPVNLIEKIQPDQFFGPFKIDTWATISKTLLIKLLGGINPSDGQDCISLFKSDKIMANCSLLFGRSVAEEFRVALTSGEKNAIKDVSKKMRRAALIRALIYRQVGALRMSLGWLKKRIMSRIARILPIFLVIGDDRENKKKVLECFSVENSFLNKIEFREWRYGNPPSSMLMLFLWVIKINILMWRDRLKDNYDANRCRWVVYDGFVLDKLTANKPGHWLLRRLVWSVMPKFDVTITCNSSNSLPEKPKHYTGSALELIVQSNDPDIKIKKSLRNIFIDAFSIKHEHLGGVWVSILGSDGCGKTTLIKNLSGQLNGIFLRAVSFHLFPGVLRRRRGDVNLADPHGKPPRSRIVSILKLVYYLLEYQFGYWIKIRPFLTRSTLILFDRYYDDLLIDPRRYRYGGSLGFARWLQRLIPRPDAFFVLDVPVQRLLERKQEVASHELIRQREAYRRYAIENPNVYLIDGAASFDDVARQVKEIVLDVRHARNANRRSLLFPKPEIANEEKYLTKSLGVQVSGDGKPSHALLHLPDGRGFFLPLNDRRLFRRGLSLYPAQGRKAVVGKAILDVMARLGIKGPCLPSIRLEEHAESVFATLKNALCRGDLSFSVSMGTPGPHRKPVIQILTREGEVLGYAKVGWNDDIKFLVTHETEILKRLGREGWSFGLPEILHVSRSGKWTVCVQSPPSCNVRLAPRRLNNLYQNALRELASKTLIYKSLDQTKFWKQILDRIQKIGHSYWRCVLIDAAGKAAWDWESKKLPVHFAHGDFAPWNALEDGGRLYLLDWEYALEEAPAGYDIFHFVIQTESLVHRRSPVDILRASMRAFENIWIDIAGQKLIKEKIYSKLIRLYLLDRLSFYAVMNERALDLLRFYSVLINAYEESQ